MEEISDERRNKLKEGKKQLRKEKGNTLKERENNVREAKWARVSLLIHNAFLEWETEVKVTENAKKSLK